MRCEHGGVELSVRVSHYLVAGSGAQREECSQRCAGPSVWFGTATPGRANQRRAAFRIPSSHALNYMYPCRSFLKSNNT